MKEVLSWNKALLAYQVVILGRTEGVDTVWTWWIKSYNCKENNIWTTGAKVSDSPWWKSMLRLRGSLQVMSPGCSSESLLADGKKNLIHRCYQYFYVAAPKVNWAPHVWNSISSPRISFLNWLIVLRRIATKDRLVKFNLLTDDTCFVFYS